MIQPRLDRLSCGAWASAAEPTIDALLTGQRAAGCNTIFEGHASSVDCDRPVMAQLPSDSRRGGLPMDRLARSVSRLLIVTGEAKIRTRGQQRRDPPFPSKRGVIVAFVPAVT
jgi:hypothetical protein